MKNDTSWTISYLTDENGRLDKFHCLQQIETLKSWNKSHFDVKHKYALTK